MKTTILKSASNKPIEFVDGVESTDQKLIILGHGAYGSGKSRFAVTAPEISGIIPIDRKTRRTIEKTVAELKQQGVTRRILMPKEDFVRDVNPMELKEMDENKSRTYFRDHVDRIKEACWALHYHKDVQCITIDLASQLYQDMAFAHYGHDFKVRKIGEKTIKDKSDCNDEFRKFLISLSSKHLILMNKSKEEWVKNKNTGRNIWQGFRDLGHECNVVVEFEKNPKWTAENGEWHWGLNLGGATDRTDIAQDEQILTDDNITFEMLATVLYPDQEWTS